MEMPFLRLPLSFSQFSEQEDKIRWKTEQWKSVKIYSKILLV